MDRFLEEVVVKKNRMVDEIIYYMANVMMIFCALATFFLMNLVFVAFSVGMLALTVFAAGMAVYLFIFRDRLRLEYEYTFTNGSLDFAQVYNNKKRKNLGSLNVRNVDAFGPVASNSFNRYISMPETKQLRWFLNKEAPLYYVVFSKEGVRKILIFEPSEQMVEYVRYYLPVGTYQA
ncbi:MAG: hypothetical protein E7333_06055 [Clostridiales bacterium]|nr:hypothetical protein [Clostridiales bacterium]